MKVYIEDASPDGLLVTFKKSFYFDTWEEVLDFIKAVDRLDKAPCKGHDITIKEE